MNTLFAHCLEIILLSAFVCAAPAVNVTNLEDLFKIANEPCVNQRAEGFPASPILAAAIEGTRYNSSNGLVKLKKALEETTIIANDTLDMIEPWTSILSLRSRSRMSLLLRKLQIPTFESGLSFEENSRLRILLQLSNYAYFLMKQENYANNYRPNEIAKLLKLRKQIKDDVCILQGLLQLTSNDIKHFVIDYVSQRLIPMDSINADVKRAMCGTAIRLMLETFKKIEVSPEAGSVIMVD